MAAEQPDILLRHIRKLVAAHNNESLPDRELLRHFAADHDEAAFETLVRRHGPMVLRVCQRVLGHAQDAEDVFQATFLILVRQAASRHWHESVGNWLYGVAYRLALETKRRAARRSKHESRAEHRSAPDPVAEITLREAQALLDEELSRLAERYRAPLVLCYLEGRTRDEAAKQLGWSLGTLKRRLEQARGRLHDRLVRRGLNLPSALTAVTIVQGGPPAVVPATLLEIMMKTVTLVATGQLSAAGQLAAPAATLAKEALRAMYLTKLKIAAAVVAVALTAAGTGLLAHQALAAKQAERKHEEQPQPLARLADKPEPKQPTPLRTDPYGDPLPEQAVARLGTIRFRPGSYISSLAFTPDAKHLVSYDGNGAVCFWDAITGRELRRFQAIRTNQRNGALSADGKWIAIPGTADDDGHSPVPIYLWDCTTGQEARAFGTARYLTVQLSSDGKLLAAIRDQNQVDLWNSQTGRLLRTWQTHAGKDGYYSFAAAQFSANGKVLVINNDQDKIVSVWDVSSGNKLREFRDVSVNKALAVSPDGAIVAVDGTDYAARGRAGEFPESRIRLLDVATGKELEQLIAAGRKDASEFSRPHGFAGAVFSADGKLLAAGVISDRLVCVWDVATAKEVRRWPFMVTMPWTLCFSPDGRTLTIGGTSLRLLDIASGKEFETPVGHQSTVHRVAFLPDSQMALTMGAVETTLHLWDAATGRERQRFECPPDEITTTAMAFGKDTFISAGRDRLIRTWNLTTGREVRRWPIEFHASSYPYPMGLVPSPDGKILALWFHDKPLHLVDAVSGKELRRLEGHAPWPFYAAFTPDGATLVSCGGDALARVWDLSAGRELRQIPFIDRADLNDSSPRPPPGPGAGWAIYTATVSPDGRLLAFGGNRFIELHEVTTGKVVWRLENLSNGVGGMCFSPDGRLLAWIAQRDATVRLIEVASGLDRHHFTGHRGRIGSVAFSPDGQRLLSGSDDTTALVWALPGKLSTSESLTPIDLELHWSILGGPDAVQAFQSMRRLAASPRQTIAYLQRRLEALLARIIHQAHFH
jgi:RNA polymerase sigma factor (sigma-70 family)